ncbi:uncharacterized protein LOC129580468 [Sitodiplosis mosellana]|uniref:uncharacterized protein LOC129580468 n=1 Tax=Sitodiplosis mosellana TaxID=263140 RepID=UPI0024442C2C|nr:uncharacterized protein LOC129580468 [Sitodiplosis mosellana]
MNESREREMLDSICDDKIFAQLTDLFGDTVPTEIILKTGQETKWKLEQCIEKLVKFDPRTVQRPMTVNMEKYNTNNNNLSDDDDADVLIESEEIQQVNTTAAKPKKPSGSAQNEEQEKRCPWPTYKQHNAGFTATNLPLPNHRPGPNSKQPRLTSNAMDKHPDVAEIIKHIEQNHLILICMRGAPGSGKSYLAKSIIDRTMHSDYDNHIFSTDDFFFNRRTKQYNFDRNRLGQAHESNQFRVAQRSMNGWSPIIVDNTNMKWWEMFNYFKTAVQYGYIIKILEPNTPWRISVGKLAQRNKHGVDQEAIARMLSNYEPGTVEDILRAMQINYPMTPQLRKFPEIQPQQQQGPSGYSSNRLSASDNGYSRFTPKEQRSTKKYDWNRENVGDYRVASSSENKLENFTEAWPAFEEEQSSFWNKDSDAKLKTEKSLPKPQRAKMTGNANIENIYSLLQDKSNSKSANEEGMDAERAAGVPLKRHNKKCTNENQSFQEIRQIYPQIPVAPLWDLFEKCNGDGNWTMDILLNESETKDLQTLNSQEEIDRDNFTCDCDEYFVNRVTPN